MNIMDLNHSKSVMKWDEKLFFLIFPLNKNNGAKMTSIIIIIIIKWDQQEMKSNSQIGERKNYHVDRQSDSHPPASSSIFHIYSPKRTELVELFEKQLKSKSQKFEYHSDCYHLLSLAPLPGTKCIALVSTEDMNSLDNSIFPEEYDQNSADNFKIFTFPRQIKLKIPNLESQSQLWKVNPTVGSGGGSLGKIKLASVHAIKVSKDKKIQSSASIKKINTKDEYRKLFYFKPNDDYGSLDHSPYRELIQVLQSIQFQLFENFKSSEDLEKKPAPKTGKSSKIRQKYLVLMPTTQNCINIMNKLKKAKVSFYDYILLGELDPNERLLEENLILASEDPLRHIYFLYQHGFASSEVKKIADHFSKKTPIQFPLEPINLKSEADFNRVEAEYKLTPFESSNSKIKTGDDMEKKKIRKIKSPTKSRNQQASQIKNESSNPNIVISKHTDEHIIETDDFRTNKQGQKIYKKSSVQSKDSIAETPVFNDQGGQKKRQFRFDSTSPQVESQFLSRKTSGYESKYRSNPSVIIQETSEEYKGSNKQSIMNLQPDRSKAQLTNDNVHIEPSQELGMRKVVNKLSTNQPETYYMNGRSVQHVPTNTSIKQDGRSNGYMGDKYKSYYGSNNNINEYYRPGNTYSSNSINTSYAANNIKSPVIQSNSNSSSSYASYNQATVNSYGNANTTSPRIIPATPITISSPNRSYGYQSPSKVVRKQQVISPLEVSQSEQKPKEENRATFGINNSYSNNTLNYSISTNNQSSYRNFNNSNAANSSSYYNPQVINYQSNTVEPYTSKIHITTGKVEEILTSAQKTQKQQIPSGQKEVEKGGKQEVKVSQNHLSAPSIQQKSTKQYVTSNMTNIFNPNDYDQIERDGRIVYRKKVPLDLKPYTPTNYTSTTVEKTQESSPAVRRYEVSPIRKDQNTHQYNYQASKSPVRQDYKSEYGRVEGYTKVDDYGGGKGGYEVITIPYKGDDHLGEMIESSHKKKKQLTQNAGRTYDSSNFVSVSYKTDQKPKNGQNGVRVYGVAHPRIEVERIEKVQPKVQGKFDSLTPLKANLNESNWFSRMSQLHSDGSILRRNNIRFGVKLQKKEEKLEPSNSVMENKMVSGIYKINDLNKKMALNRIIRGQDYIEEEREKYIHINIRLNRYHFIVQEEMEYLSDIVNSHLANPHDQIDKFTGISSLFACLKAETDQYDIGFIFAKSQEIAHINSQLIPEHYFTVCIEKEQEGLLEINQGQKKIKIDQLKHFTLVQQIILDSKLYQYVAYRNNKPQIELLADKFMNSEFILQKIETEFSPEILDCYYYELPRLTRLYVLCDKQELSKMLQLMKTYKDLNSTFNKDTCKIVCVLSSILDNEELIMSHPTVTFISNPEEIKDYKSILKYAHHQEEAYSKYLPIDNIFFYQKHKNLEAEIADKYPGRFLTYPFAKVAQLYPEIQKIQKIAARHNHKPKNYLVLHENVNAEKIRLEYFTKIFMLGKAKVIQNKVVRVMNSEELLELLKK